MIMDLIKLVDFETKYLVGFTETEVNDNLIFFVRIDRSLKEMILNAREHIKQIKEDYKCINSIKFIDYTPEYLNNENKKYLSGESFYYQNSMPFDVDDHFENNGTSDRIMMINSSLEVSEFGFGWNGITINGHNIRTAFFDFNVLNEI